MTQERNLTLRNDLTITPAELVENASIQAKLLMNIVEQTRCYQTISGKKYLQLEAWETIGAFNRVHAVTRQTNPIIREGEIVGYQADVELLKDGVIVGGASMPCFFTENACRGKEGDAKHKACMSAAQTFATSKAYRMNYSYVAILAGYQPTPAEEMTGEAADDRPANLEHWCEEHKTKFFKRGKMPRYAHPIEGTKEWCNEPSKTEPEPSLNAPEPQNTGIKDKTSGNLPGVEGFIDLNWLKESLDTLQWVDVGGYLKRKYKVSGAKVSDLVSRLDKEQADEFVQEVQNRLAMR